MAVPVVTGSLQLIQSGSSSSQSVTVPSDCTAVLVCMSWWRSVNTNDAITACSLGGQSGSLVNKQTDWTYSGGVSVWLINGPSTGSQTFAWTLADGTLVEGVNFYLVFLKNTAASPITASVVQVAPSSGYGGVITSPSLTTSTNDLCVVAGYSWQEYATASAAPSGSGQTQLGESTPYGQTDTCQLLVGSKTGPGSSTTMQIEGSYPGLVAVSVAGDLSVSKSDSIVVADAPTVGVSAADLSISVDPSNSDYLTTGVKIG